MKYERLTEKAENGKPYFDGCLHCDLESDCGLCPYWESGLNRLAEIEDKIEHGTLIELPCKVGDTIWCIEGFCDDSNDIVERVVYYLVLFANSIDIHASIPKSLGQTRAYDTRKIGKTVFLTREDAEKRLKELQQ